MKLLGMKIIRPVNCAFSFLLTLLAYSISIGYIYINLSASLAAISTFLIAGGGNTLNDFVDYKIDSKNKRYRPIPSKLITRKEAFVLSMFLFLLGLIASAFVNSNAFMIATVATLTLIAYGFKGRYLGLSGDILISFLTALVFIMGAFVATDKIPFSITLIAVAAFTINVSREIVKDIEDYEADKGLKLTLPQKIGKRKAALVALAFLAGNFFVAYVLLPIYFTGIVFLLSMPIMIFLFTKVFKNLKTPNVKAAEESQRIIKLMMFAEFAFVFLDKFVINLST